MEGPSGRGIAGQKLLRLSDYDAINDDADNGEDDDLEIRPPQQTSKARRVVLTLGVVLAAIAMFATVWMFVMLTYDANRESMKHDVPRDVLDTVMGMLLTPLMFFVWLYLIPGLRVLWVFPERSRCIVVVENNCCASKKGAARCLARLNIFLSIPLFICMVLGLPLCIIGPVTCGMSYVAFFLLTLLLIGNGIGLYLQSSLILADEAGVELNAIKDTDLFGDELPVAVPAASLVPRGLATEAEAVASSA